MNLELDNKVAIITGGAKGIGEGITRAFAAEGAVAVILGRNADEAQAIIDDLAAQGQRADAFHAEMTCENDIKTAVSAILSQYGRIDVIVNNAGGNDAVGLRATPDQFATSLERNVVHYFTLAHYALDALIESGGNIVNIGSKTAETGQGNTSGYAAAKGAINALTREWALDLATVGVRVNCVVPAEVMTPLYERWLEKAPDPVRAREQLDRTVPLGHRTTTIAEIADTVAFIASARSSHTTGQIIYPDGGYVHLDRACTADTSHL
ncbi:MAG: SDR family oxidoreductase [Verrucomicrobiae bacterium]|nr:SDR family oxidoreductase [Verrucomicrobiae bacterium]NNJ43650.1 SDR family oxidoreductase [Akkermansiaceae bacterium]